MHSEDNSEDNKKNTIAERLTRASLMFVTALVTAIIVGGGVYLWQNPVLRSAEEIVQNQVDYLQEQVGELTDSPLSPETVSPASEEALIEGSPHVGPSNLYLRATSPEKGAVIAKLPNGSIVDYVAGPIDSYIDASVTISGTTYDFSAPGGAGGPTPCSIGDLISEGCGYDDENLKTTRPLEIRNLRVWFDKSGVIALNITSLQVGSHSMEAIMVRKQNKQAFSVAEISMWREIFQSISAES